jgi:hypothetical protein
MTYRELVEKLRYAILHAPEIADQNATFYVNSEYLPIKGVIIGDKGTESRTEKLPQDKVFPGGAVLLTVEGDSESNIRYKIKEMYGHLYPKTQD